MPISGGGSGGGGPAAGTYLPVADHTGVTVDTSSYANGYTGVGNYTTLVFPQETGTLAIAITGDAHPRWILPADPNDGLVAGNGTVDPVPSGAGFGAAANGDGSLAAFVAGGTGLAFKVGAKDTNAGTIVQAGNGIKVSGAAIISSGANAPAIGGNVGDLFIRTNPASDATYFYRCTVAGTAGNATWAAITGA